MSRDHRVIASVFGEVNGGGEAREETIENWQLKNFNLKLQSIIGGHKSRVRQRR
jgi:hypothetical protein